MLGYKFKLTNTNGDFFYINDFVTDPLNFVALQNFPGFEVDIRNNEAPREGQHGIYDFFSFYGKRVINFQGVIVGANEASVETLKLQILKVLSLPPIPSNTNDGEIDITWTDANSSAWQISAKLQGYPRFDREFRQGYKLLFTFTLKAKNPEIESQALNTVSGDRGWVQGGLILNNVILPASFPIVYNQEFTVTNAGPVPANTIITLYGEATRVITNPSLYNRTTGKLFKLNVVLLNDTEFVTINSKDGSVVDQSGADKSSFVDSAGEYILLNPGVNNLMYISDETPLVNWDLPTANVEVSHRTTII